MQYHLMSLGDSGIGVKVLWYFRLLMSKLPKQSCYYLLIICWTVQVVDKPFHVHIYRRCAIASGTLPLAHALCERIVSVVFSLL